MERLRFRSLMGSSRHAAAGFLAAAAVAVSAGCVTTAGKLSPAKAPDIPPPAAAPAAGLALPSMPSFVSAPKSPPAAEMLAIWRNQIDELPDPSRSGQMVTGLAGQLFLFTETLQPADANGTLTVDMHDLTPRQPGVGPPPLLPERWQFDKEALRKLLSPDEKWGRGYVLFLPWRAFRPDVNRVQISARFDPESGHPLYTKPQTVTINPKEFGTPTVSTLPNVPASALPRPQPIPSGQPLSAGPTNGWPGPGVVQTGGMMPANPTPQALPPSMTGAPQAWTPGPTPNAAFAPQGVPHAGFPQPGMPMMPVNQGAAAPAWPSANPLAPNGVAVPGMNPTGGGIGQGVMVINRLPQQPAPQQPAPPAQPVVPVGYR